MKIQDIAAVAHAANREVQKALNEKEISPPWDLAPDWMKQSSIDGVKKAIVGLTPRELHKAWMETRLRAGWKFGPEKSEDLLTHPCLVDYDDLTKEQQMKDTLFVSVVQALYSSHSLCEPSI